MKNYKLCLLVILLVLLSTQRNIMAQELWGMTSAGGTNNLGVLFKYDLTSNSYTKKLDFTGSANGSNPKGSLIQASNDKLYGMTNLGGIEDLGMLFEYDPASSTYIWKITFLGSYEGAFPTGSLVQASNGKLYAMTSEGGVFGLGVLFEYDPATYDFIKRLDFDGSQNGSRPQGSLLQASNGKLYGMTSGGGIYSVGVLFEYDPSTNAFIKKIDFSGLATGGLPYGNLIQASNGKLYGMTLNGGANNWGALFEYDPVAGSYFRKVDFDGTANGGNPFGSLMQASNGKIYGMTTYGGTLNYGVLFEYDPVSGSYAKKVDFDGAARGRYPFGSLMQASNGKLYGMTELGGTSDLGVIFEYDPASSSLTKILDFDGTNGAKPWHTALVEVKSASAPVAVCQNATLQLDANGQATLQASDIDGGSTGNGISLSVSKTNFTCADIGENTVVLTVTDRDGNTSTCNATVTVQSNDQLTAMVSAIASNNPVCAGTTLIFTAQPINGGAAPTYQWKLGGTDIPDATGETYSYAPSNGDAISVVMTSNSECASTSPVTSNTVILSVFDLPMAPTVGSITQPNCAVPTGSVVLNGLPSGNWTINPGAIAGSTTSTTISGLNPGTYNFTVTNSSGCISPQSADVVINVPSIDFAAPTVTLSQPSCDLPTGTITITSPLGKGITYSIGGKYQASTTFSKLVPGSYNLTAKNSDGCISPVTNVEILPNPAPSQPGNFTTSTLQVTQGQADVVYTVPFVNGVTYEWNYSGTGANISGSSNSVTVTFSASATSGTLSVTASSNGCTSIPRSLRIKVNRLKSGHLTEAMQPPTEISMAKYNLKVFPNPFTEKLTLEFSNETDVHAKLDIYSITGAKLATLFDGHIRGGEVQTVEYLPKLISSQMVLYHLILDGKTYIGKATFNEKR